MANKKGEVYFGEKENNNNNNNNNNKKNKNNNNQGFVYENNNTFVRNNNNNKPKSPSEILSDLILANDVAGVRTLLETLEKDNKAYLEVMKNEGPYINLAIQNIDRNFEGKGAKDAMEIFNKLLKAGFSLNQEFMGDKPVQTAAGMENEKASEILLKILVLSNNLSANGEKNDNSPLLNALGKNHHIVADLLLKMGADKNKIVKGTPLLHQVLFDLKNLKAAEYLLNKGANVNRTDLVEDTILHKLIKSTLPQDFLDKAYALILNSPHLSAYTSDGLKRQPLLSAVYQGNLYAVKKLLDSPRRQFITVVELQQVPADARNFHSVSDKTPFLIALKRSSFSPDSPDKNPAKEPIYNQILKELIMKKYENTKRDWDSVWIHMNAAGIPLSFFIQKILVLNDTELLDHFIKGGIIDKSFSIDSDNLLTFSLKQLEKGTIGIDTIKYLLDLGLDPNAPSRSGLLPMLIAYQTGKKEVIALLEKYGGKKEGFFIAACQMGNVDVVKDLIKQGENPTQTVKINGKEYTGYDLATSMRIKLFLAPYFEKDEPKFVGFKKQDFAIFESLFTIDETVEKGFRFYAICPICFLIGQRDDGCMYIWDHNCYQEQAKAKRRGEFVHIHEKLYETYNEGGNIKFCLYCNRLTNDKGAGGAHRHYDIGGPVPVKSLLPKNLEPRGSPFAPVCYESGGGDVVEKVYRLQELLKFMCHLNEKFIGKISQNMAYNMTKECFIGAAVPYTKFFTSYQGQPRNDDERRVVALKDDVIKNKHFSWPPTCKAIDGPVFALEIKAKKNIPRPAQNANLFPKVLKQQVYDPAAIEAGPVPPTVPSRNLPGPQYAEAFQKYQNELVPYRQLIRAYNARLNAIAQRCEYHSERHTDGRDLYQFYHRQPDGSIFDHPDYLICKEGLVEFLNFLVEGEGKSISCFDYACEGYIHPLEVKDLMTTDEEKRIYEESRRRFNAGPPQALQAQAGGSNNEPKRFTSLFYVDPEGTKFRPCKISSYQRIRIGGRRHKTQKGRKARGARRRTRKQ